MTRPSGLELARNNEYAVLQVESLWAITYQGTIAQISEDIFVSLSKQRKYPKSVYRTRANAVTHSKKLNKMFNTEDFSVVCLFQRTHTDKE